MLKPGHAFCPSRVLSGHRSLHTGAAYTLCATEEASRDHYQVLGVERNATKTEIRTAFVKLSKRYHPDSNPLRQSVESNSRAFVAVSEAYQTLRNPNRRAEYDRKLAVAEAYQQSMYRGSGASNTHQPFSSDRYPTYSPGRGAASHQYYSYDDGDVDWELYQRSIRRPNHSRVLFMLLGLTFTVPVLFMMRVNHNYHKYYQPAAILESQRNTAAYKAVRERAKKATVQEQLDLLVARHANRASKHVNNNSPTTKYKSWYCDLCACAKLVSMETG